MTEAGKRRVAAWRGDLVPSCACEPVELVDDGERLICDRCRKPARERKTERSE